MAGNQFFPYSDFDSTPYDLDLWLNPRAASIETLSTVSSYSDYPSDLIYDDNESFSNFEISNWYVNDLIDQLHSLRKLPNQSIKSYLAEAKSLLHALEKAGHSMPESEFTDCLVDGLDDAFHGAIQYYLLMNLSLDSLVNLLIGHETMPAKFNPLSSTGLNTTSSVDGSTSFVRVIDDFGYNTKECLLDPAIFGDVSDYARSINETSNDEVDYSLNDHSSWLPPNEVREQNLVFHGERPASNGFNNKLAPYIIDDATLPKDSYSTEVPTAQQVFLVNNSLQIHFSSLELLNSQLRSQVHSNDISFLVVPSSCQLSKSEILISFLTHICGYTHPLLDVFQNSYLVCSEYANLSKGGTTISKHFLDVVTNLHWFGLGVPAMERQLIEMFQKQLLDEDLRVIHFGTATLKDATSAVIQDWENNVGSTHYILRFLAGSYHLYAMILRECHTVLSKITWKAIMPCAQRLLLSYPHYVIKSRWLCGFIFDRGKFRFQTKVFPKTPLVCGGMLGNHAKHTTKVSLCY